MTSEMEKASYLFVHFTGESESGEQIYFSLSRDGLHWEDVNHGEPVLRSEIGEKGVRDPFLIRDEKKRKVLPDCDGSADCLGKGLGSGAVFRQPGYDCVVIGGSGSV